MVRVLLLAAPIGSGHKMTAQALAEELARRPGVEVVQGDIFDFLPAWVGRTFLRCYLEVLRVCPWLYGLAYSSGNGGKGSFLWVRNLFNKYMLRQGKRFLEDQKPDLVMATHATPLGIMSLYKAEHPKIWLGAVVPDYNIHHWWRCEHVDAYFLADPRLTERVAPHPKILAWGLPLRHDFQLGDRATCRAEHKIAPQDRALLLMGGGNGLLPMEAVLKKLVALQDEHLRILAICGNNYELVDRLQNTYAEQPNVDIYGFRNDIPDLMSAADIIVTKAGAVTAAEVLASELSYIIYKPLPGQEEGNAQFLAHYHHAMIAHSVEDIVKFVAQPQALVQVAELTVQQRKLAAERICDYVLQEKK